ncbi:MAG: phosphoserine phosphatase SerB [Betaproteobacteria bacterium]
MSSAPVQPSDPVVAPQVARIDLVVQAPDIDTALLKSLARLTGASTIEALAAAETQAFRLADPTRCEGVADFCVEAGLDFGFVPKDQRLDRVGLVAMDMDSTLITIECIDEIADMIGIKPQVAAITAAAMRGEIDFRESLTRRVALLEGLDIAALQRVYDERLRLSQGAQRMLEGFKRAGATTLLVSGGFTFFTGRLQVRLPLDYTLANVLDVAGDRLTGRIEGSIVDANVKADEFTRLAAALAPGALTVAVGDGANDLPMLAAAGVSVAYRAKHVVRERADYAIDHCGLDAILNLFR